jgi:DNA-binding response OmpR family regulator
MNTLPAARQKPRVLVVDDDHDMADLMQLILNRTGFLTLVAYSGSAALVMAPIYVPQVVLLDIAMPGMNGLELARRLRELPQTKQALLICVSGLDTEKDREESSAAGCDYYLLKPVDWRELVRLMEQR